MKKHFLIAVSIMSVLSSQAFADNMQTCQSLAGSVWNGQITNVKTQNTIKPLSIHINFVPEKPDENGRYYFSGGDFNAQMSFCAEKNNRVTNVTLGLFANGKVMSFSDEQPSANILKMNGPGSIQATLLREQKAKS